MRILEVWAGGVEGWVGWVGGGWGPRLEEICGCGAWDSGRAVGVPRMPRRSNAVNEKTVTSGNLLLLTLGAALISWIQF